MEKTRRDNSKASVVQSSRRAADMPSSPVPMTEPIGLRIWSEFTRLRSASSDEIRHFGQLPVASVLYAGDGGTFACHVKERVKKGTWLLYRLSLDDLGVVLAVRDGSDAIDWEFAGGIIIDSSVGTILPAASFKEITAMEDSDDLTDAIDDALFGSDDDEAVLETSNGRAFAVFQLGGDGNYNVFKGIDQSKATCALAVVMWDRDYAKEIQNSASSGPAE